MNSVISDRLSHWVSEALAKTNSSVPPMEPSPMTTAVRRVGIRLKNTHQYIMMLPWATPNRAQEITETASGIPANAMFTNAFATAASASSEPMANRRLRFSKAQSAFHAQKANVAASVSTDTMRKAVASRISQNARRAREGLKVADSSHPMRNAKPMVART